VTASANRIHISNGLVADTGEWRRNHAVNRDAVDETGKSSLTDSRTTNNADQRRSQEFDLGGYKCELVIARRQNNHIKNLR